MGIGLVTDKAGKSNEQRVQNLLDDGYQAYIEGEYSSARSLFSKAVSLDCDSPEAHYYCGCVHEMLEEPAMARPYYERCLALEQELHGRKSPEYARAIHNLGINAAWLREYEKSLELAQQALAVIDGDIVQPSTVSDDQWHQKVGRLTKIIALGEAYHRNGQSSEASEVMMSIADCAIRPSDELVLLRIVLGANDLIEPIISWHSAPMIRMLDAILRFSGLYHEVDIAEFYQVDTQERALGILRQRQAALQNNVNPRLML